MALVEQLESKNFLNLYRALEPSFTLEETYNVEELKNILDHPMLRPEDKRKLTELYNKVKDTGRQNVRYVRGEYGRYYPQQYGYTQMYRHVRSQVLPPDVIDVDAVSCFPSAMFFLISKTGESAATYKHLEAYCHDRKPYIESLIFTDEELADWNRRTLDTMTRAEFGKHIMNAMMYGSGKQFLDDLGIKNPFKPRSLASLFKSEWQSLGKKLADLQEYVDVISYVKNRKQASGGYYHRGNVLSILLQSFETLCVRNLMNLLKRNGVKITAYIYDGLNVIGDIEDNLAPCNDCLPLRFIIKPHPAKLRDIEFPEQLEQDDDIDEPIVSYKEARDMMEESYCKISEMKCWIKRARNTNIIMKPEAFCHATAELTYKETFQVERQGKTVTETRTCYLTDKDSPYWRDAEKRMYDSVVMAPPAAPQCPDNMYNLWLPYRCDITTPYTENTAALEKFLFVIECLCNHDKVVMNYVLDWIAHLVQFPGVKSSMLVFVSDEGAGKSWVIEVLSNMLGKGKVITSTQPERDVWGNFNGLMSDGILVVLNEIDKTQTAASGTMGKLKGLVTDKSLIVNPKGLPAYEMDSFHRYWLNTNSKNPILVDRKTRRIVPIRCSDELGAPDKKTWWTPLWELLDDVDFLRTVFDYFKKREVDKNFATIPLPQTQYCLDLKEQSEPVYVKFLRDYLDQLKSEHIADGKHKAFLKDLFPLFKSWMVENKLDWTGNSTKLAFGLANCNLPGVIRVNKTRELSAHFELEMSSLQEALNILPTSV